jgi:hypothetical protein
MSPVQQSPLQLLLFYLQIGATTALLFRLYWSGLSGTYKALTAYFSIQLAEFIILALVRSHGTLYAYAYFAGQCLKLIVGVAVVLELYRVALAQQPSLSRYGRQTVGFVLGAAALLAVCGLMLASSVPTGQSQIVHDFLSFERTMNAALLFFLLLISLFLLWFPVRLKRNVALYIGGFLIYSVARSFGLLFVNILPMRFTVPLGTGMLVVSGACLIGWVLALRREGEEATTVVGHRWNQAAIGHLTDQLDSINSSLARLSR